MLNDVMQALRDGSTIKHVTVVVGADLCEVIFHWIRHQEALDNCADVI